MATTAMCFGAEGEGNEGKTTTALGAHEWLKSAVSGEMETPRLDRSVGEVSAKEFEVNCEKRDTSDMSGGADSFAVARR